MFFSRVTRKLLLQLLLLGEFRHATVRMSRAAEPQLLDFWAETLFKVAETPTPSPNPLQSLCDPPPFPENLTKSSEVVKATPRKGVTNEARTIIGKSGKTVIVWPTAG